jgi:mannose-6-phosphate isomerase-like protein (cupin superfamily)
MLRAMARRSPSWTGVAARSCLFAPQALIEGLNSWVDRQSWGSLCGWPNLPRLQHHDGVLPAHSHPHEQVVNVLDGEFELVVEGTPHVLRTGDVFAIPGNAPHSGQALTSCWILDVFCPIREDYRTA